MREKTLFSNEASNYQLGGQFAAVPGFVLYWGMRKGLVTCPRNGLLTLGRDAQELQYRTKQNFAEIMGYGGC